MTVGPSMDSDVTWLLHRAAQRMRTATGDLAEKRGLRLREYIILSALDAWPDLTQGELGRALGLDKTTLWSDLDRLVGMGHVVRRPDPHDRRARIPAITDAGRAVRAQVAEACAAAEAAALSPFTGEQVQAFRRMLFEMIGDTEDPGSCL